MSRILIVAEGQTEETFVRDILTPHLATFGVYARAMLAATKRVKVGPDFKGGIVSYERLRADIRRLLGDTNARVVTTLIDFYGLPPSVPGIKTQPKKRSCYDRVAHVEDALRKDIDDKRFLPYLALHEFEAMLFSAPEVISDTAEGDTRAKKALLDIRNQFSSPEEIDDGPDTTPSKRILSLLTRYRKPLHGPLISQRIGLETIRSECSRFNDWLTKLENISS